MSSMTIPKVVPAQLSFLAVYNPSLGTSDETFHNQIVFYYSKAAKARAKIDGSNTHEESELREQENEKLRQVGLAQGMVGFARSFSNGEAVDSVETHKSRIVLRELEESWWILAVRGTILSIDLTQLPAATSRTDAGTDAALAIEYSSREVSHPALLLQQLERANATFLLHHGLSLRSLFSKLGRDKFCNTLDKFWTRFANNWDVLLHGSPAVDVFGGMKLAAGGELGMGVGEEEWGSGEREVLEDYARRTDGLVDIVVSRFGEPSSIQDPTVVDKTTAKDPALLEAWLGSGRTVNAVDGIVFSGTGAVSRRSLRDISHWVENIYTYGEHVYGVRDNPLSNRRKRRRKNPKPIDPDASSTERPKPHIKSDTGVRPGIPPPIATAAEASLNKVSDTVDAAQKTAPNRPEPMMASLGDTDMWMKYLTLGYGTAWGGKKPQIPEQDVPDEAVEQRAPSPEVSMRYIEPAPEVDRTEEKLAAQLQNENSGYFIIGLKGNLEEDETVDDEDEEGDSNNRIFLRTLHVELSDKTIPGTPGLEDDVTPSYERDLSFTPSLRKLSRLRPVVYVHRPFIYTFLFQHRTEALTLSSFYRNLHIYFSPLHRPLSNSTSPDKVATRIAAASNPHTTTASVMGSGSNKQPIYDLVFDPRTLTVHTSLPNIPEPGTLTAEGLSENTLLSGWSRVEALNVHSQILATVSSTRRTLSEIERTCKTNRGWWVVWLRLPPSNVNISTDSQAESQEFNAADLREAFLVRRAGDAVSSSTQSSGSRLGSGMWKLGGASTGEKMGGAAAGWGPKGLAEGIGIDPRRYVEGLLSLNR
ncbi:hypothetical protein K491DRAFT_585554 [Lophiostoma macrostomum CBS 122681]|uniref:CCZ1/INTU/HSP4 first Longin domain-containing protein n=1 Tax=Lophiostoma macrostomum CBS 122681 TaxID=1314788 RepID=A0A6A6TQE8_9PLEO|nr:hypothetical protein K491DRAFT_585554 [Lophiostoma macrostomum CBS 122681]